VKSPVITSWVLTTARVAPLRSAFRVSGPPLTTRSQPISRSAPPEAMRTVLMSSDVAAMRMWLITAPFFCASPVMSSTPQPLPSTCAAMPSSCPMVTTPVPPTPVTTMP